MHEENKNESFSYLQLLVFGNSQIRNAILLAKRYFTNQLHRYFSPRNISHLQKMLLVILTYFPLHKIRDKSITIQSLLAKIKK